MREAGYKESTVQNHAEVMGSVRVQSEMQKALEDAGVSLPLLAERIMDGLGAMKEVRLGRTEDAANRHQYVGTAAELPDVFPAKKTEGKMVHSGAISLSNRYDDSGGT